MNYRHAYHAGNFADVLKHLMLVFAIRHLAKKDKPFRVIDTHAGLGVYDLASDAAQRTGEWIDGVGRLTGSADAQGFNAEAASTLRQDPVVAAYLEAVAAVQNPDGTGIANSEGEHEGEGGQLCRYPGSPAIAAALLRPQDTLIANELHPEDAGELKAHFARNRQVKVMSIDGWLMPKSALPPKERRGLVLIDPPFEVPGEFDRMVRALSDGLERFATGIYMFWYPLKDAARVARFKADMTAAARAPVLCAELFVRTSEPDERLSGTGLLVHAPPYGLDAWLSNIATPLTECLRQGGGARLDVGTL